MKPEVKVRISCGTPEIRWKEDHQYSVEIWVSRGNQEFVFLAVDTISPYIDTHGMPSKRKMEVYKYRAIFRWHDSQVGEWSDEVSLNVVGP